MSVQVKDAALLRKFLCFRFNLTDTFRGLGLTIVLGPLYFYQGSVSRSRITEVSLITALSKTRLLPNQEFGRKAATLSSVFTKRPIMELK